MSSSSREVTRSGFDVVGLDRRRPSAELEASVERFVVGDAAGIRVVAGPLRARTQSCPLRR